MLRATLDSSVLVSAFITPGGVPGQVLDASERGDFVLCLSGEIIAETSKVLLRGIKLQVRYGFGAADVDAFCDGLLATAHIVSGPPVGRFVPLDPKDDMVVATAIAAEAGYLVTGDCRHLLSLGSVGAVRIVTPRAFLGLL